MNTRVHPTAIVETGVVLGDGTAVWDNVHIRHHAVIGRDCILGGKSYIAYDVRIGDRCKIGPYVNVCVGVRLGTGVMVGVATVFTNELYPRATTTDLRRLRDSGPTAATLPTVVEDGVTIGGNCSILGGVTIGRWAMIGLGSVVTKSIPAFALVAGTPAKQVGWVCRCGQPLVRFRQRPIVERVEFDCIVCGLRYAISPNGVEELTPPVEADHD